MDLTLIIRNIVLIVLILFIIPMVLIILKKHINKLHNEELKRIIETLVSAAEQLLKEEDPTGEKRKQFVISKLEELGIKHTTLIDSIIEACVFELNNFLF